MAMKLKMNRKTKKIIQNIFLGVLCLGTVGCLAAGGKALYDYSQEDLKTIHPTFHVGGLDTRGEYVDTDQSLYSNAFECKGLEIKLDFDNDIKYNLYFYESDGDYVTNLLDQEDDFSFSEENLRVNEISKITHARILISPQWTNVEIPDDKTEEDVKVVKWTNISSFVKQLEIKVSKNQDVVYDLLTNDCGEILKNSIVNPGGQIDETEEKINVFTFEYDCTHNYKITYPKKFDTNKLNSILGAAKTKANPGEELQVKMIFRTDELKDNSFIIDTSEYNAYGCVIYINYLENCQPIVEIIERN